MFFQKKKQASRGREFWWVTTNQKLVTDSLLCHCPDDEMVDIGDLKSPGLNSRAGSSPALGTKTKRWKAFLFWCPEKKRSFCPDSNDGAILVLTKTRRESAPRPECFDENILSRRRDSGSEIIPDQKQKTPVRFERRLWRDSGSVSCICALRIFLIPSKWDLSYFLLVGTHWK